MVRLGRIRCCKNAVSDSRVVFILFVRVRRMS